MYRIVCKCLSVVLVLLFVFLPSIEVDGLKEPTVTGKFLFFSVCVGLLAILFFFLLLVERNSTRTVSQTDIFLLVIVLFVIIMRHFTELPPFSIRYYELLGLIILYIILRNMPLKHIYYFLFAAIAGGIIQAIYGNLQLYGLLPSNHSVYRITGSFFNPGPYSGYLAGVFPFSLGMYLYHENRELQNKRQGGVLNNSATIKYSGLIGVITALLILPAAQSRAAWIAIITGTLFLISGKYRWRAVSGKYFNTHLKKKLAAVSLFVMLSIAIAGMFSLKPASGLGRLFIWKVSTEIIKDYPLTGVGFDRFKASYMDYQASWFRSAPRDKAVNIAGDVEYAFNEFLQMGVENGLPAALLTAFLVFNLFRSKGETPVMLRIARAGILTPLLFSFFSYPAQILPIKLNCVLCLSIISSLYAREKAIIRLKNSGSFFYRAVLIAAIPLFIFIVFKVSGRINTFYKAYKDWDTAFNIYSVGLHQESIPYYSQAYPVFCSSGQFLTQYGKALSMAKRHYESIKILNRAEVFQNSLIVQTAKGDSYKAIKKYRSAEKAYLQASNMLPGRFYPKYLLVKLYLEEGQKEKAVRLAKEILTKDIKIESPAINEIKEEMRTILKK